MNTNLQGNIGEAKVMNYFIENGYTVYLPFGTASKNDMIIEKDNIIERVSVKTSNTKNKSGNYKVRIRQGKLNKQIPFDKNSCEILAIYILPEDKIVLKKATEIVSGFELVLKR
jgi:hypothetical protein